VALDAGATTLKEAKKSFWGYGGVDNVEATKQFYVDRGLTAAKSFGKGAGRRVLDDPAASPDQDPRSSTHWARDGSGSNDSPKY
jgi:hypothetical protein